MVSVFDIKTAYFSYDVDTFCVNVYNFRSSSDELEIKG